MRLKKVGIAAAAILVLFLAAAFFSMNWAVRHGVRTAVRRSLGMEVEIRDLDVRFLRATDIRIEDLTIYNPEGFEGEVLARIPLIYVDYELGSLFKNRVHCTLVELNVEEVAVMKNAAGEVNLNRLAALLEGEESPPGKSDHTQPPTEVRIDRLVLTFDRVKFKDISGGEAARERTLRIGLNHEEFEDLSSVEEIVQVVVLKGLVTAGLANIGVAVERLGSMLKNVRGKGMEALKGVTSAMKEGVGRIRDKGGRLLKKVKPGE
ncbi:MAG: hypothetical protein HYU36_04225 [Planctomycetes bacterium]|nr:hypothetical protein [Planctomycetota bacterium]